MRLKSHIYNFSLKILFRLKQRRVNSKLGGLNWSLDLNNALDVHLRQRDGVYHSIMPFLFNVLDAEKAVIDIGANSGYWTLPLAQHFFLCYSLEADSDNYDKLQINVSLNPDLKDRTFLLNAAATDFDGVSNFNIRRSLDADANLNTGLSSLVIQDYGSITREVRAVRIDSIVKSTANKVCLIKIDVEGAEFQVLVGAERLIKGSHPFIFWEATLSLDVKFNRQNVPNCWMFLKNHGYMHLMVFEDGKIKECSDIEELSHLGFDLDILSVHSSNFDDFMDKFNHWHANSL